MAVYIDNANIWYRGMYMSHMLADTTEELLEMVDKVGLDRKWIQYPGTHKEHFDICQTKKTKALKLGAKRVCNREVAELMLRKMEG